MKIKTVYIGVLVVLAVCGNAYAAPVNLGFESGLDGWTLGAYYDAKWPPNMIETGRGL